MRGYTRGRSDGITSPNSDSADTVVRGLPGSLSVQASSLDNATDSCSPHFLALVRVLARGTQEGPAAEVRRLTHLCQPAQGPKHPGTNTSERGFGPRIASEGHASVIGPPDRLEAILAPNPSIERRGGHHDHRIHRTRTHAPAPSRCRWAGQRACGRFSVGLVGFRPVIRRLLQRRALGKRPMTLLSSNPNLVSRNKLHQPISLLPLELLDCCRCVLAPVPISVV